MPLNTALRAAATYGLATVNAAVAATLVTVPLGPQPASVITAVWVSAAASTGYATLVVCDGFTFGRKDGRR